MAAQLMSLIDKNKKKFNDGDYLNMCNILKEIKNEEDDKVKKNKNKFIIKYWKISLQNSFHSTEIKMNKKIKTKVVIVNDNDIETLLSFNDDFYNSDCEDLNINFIKDKNGDITLVLNDEDESFDDIYTVDNDDNKYDVDILYYQNLFISCKKL